MALLHAPWGVAALAVLCVLVSCGTSPSPEPVTPKPAPSEPASPSPGPGSTNPHTEADVRFMSAMIGHHAQAVTIAQWAATHGAGPSVRTLAERIVVGQGDEIASMRQWLRDRDLAVPHTGHAAMGQHHMPGMLTAAQLRQLDQTRGAEFDRLFLTLLIQHHRGAVAMVEELFATPGAAQDETVFKFANDVHVDQTTEIARMERMLSALPAGDSPS